MASQLFLQLLGPPQLLLNDTLIIPNRRTVIALLAYLAVNQSQRFTREFLSSLLWPEQAQDKAFTNLRHTLWEIHRSIGADWLVAERETIRLNPEACISLDIIQFQDTLTKARCQSELALRIPLLLADISIYRNHFLTGFSLKGALEFNEWTYLQSEGLRAELASALVLLVEAYLTQGEAESAIPHARRLISIDPLDESAHRRLMEVYLQAGQRAIALKQYQTCEQILRKELGIDPQPETRALYKKIHKGEMKANQAAPSENHAVPIHNLPAQLTSFIGREKARDEVCDILGAHALVTLAGDGGIGKTRLALQVGEQLLTGFADGVWFVAFDRLTDPCMLPQAVASVFEIRDLPSKSTTERLVDVLEEKRTLLILDNCEHLLEAATQLIEVLLKKCLKLKILATSREVLGIEGEAIYQVTALSLPGNRLDNQPDNYESIRLFKERAALILRTFRITEENAAAVTGICQKVDGIPLAIELASARVDILTPEEILAQLNMSFALLANRGHASVARYQSMRASMDWSWGLLAKQEQIFLQRVSVFSGGWTLEAAQSVCANGLIQEEMVLELTGRLAKKSLLMADQSKGQATRYRLHEIVRQYAREKLDNEEKIRSRHLEFFAKFTARAEITARGPASMECLTEIEKERGNLLAALEWAVESDIEAGLQVAGSLERYWFLSDIRGGEYWLNRLLEKRSIDCSRGACAKALRVHAGLLSSLVQEQQACSDVEEALHLYQLDGDRHGETACLLTMADAAGSKHGTTQVMEKAQRALDMARSQGDIWQQGEALFAIGWNCEDPPRRSRYWEKSVELLRQAGDVELMMAHLTDKAFFEYAEGNLIQAQKEFEKLIFLDDQVKRRILPGNILFVRAQFAIMRGDYEQGRDWFDELIAYLKRTGDWAIETWIRVRTGYLAVLQGDLEQARAIFANVSVDFQAQSSEIGLAFTFEGLANLFVRTGKYEQAAHLIGWSDGVRKRNGYPRPQGEQADVDRIITACLLKIGEEKFSDAYDEGQASPIEQVMSLALEGRVERPASMPK